MRWGRLVAGIVLAISLVVQGCSVTPKKLEAKQDIHSIGIISAIGDDLVYRNVPFFRWGQEEYHRDVSAWKIDGFMTDKITQALQPQYSVLPVEFDRAAFVDKKLFGRVNSSGAFPNADPVADIVRAHVRNPKADMYLVVLGGSAPVNLSATPAEGIGVVRYPLIGDNHYYAHAVYRIVLVDGRSFEALAIQEARNDDSFALDGILNGSPYEAFEPEHWAEENERVTAAQVEWVRDRIKALLERTLPGTLRRLNLIGS